MAYAYGSNYPTNSGPPPPPGIGVGDLAYTPCLGVGTGLVPTHSSAYNVHNYSPYPQMGYGMGTQPPQPGPGMGDGGAVPGLTSMPAVQNCQQLYQSQGYAQQHVAPPPAQPPPSIQMQRAANHAGYESMMNMQIKLMEEVGLLSGSEEEYEDDEGCSRRRRRKNRKFGREHRRGEDDVELEAEYQMPPPTEEEVKKKQEEIKDKLSGDEGLRVKMKECFQAGIQRCLKVVKPFQANGTLDVTEGTIKPFRFYDEADPVVLHQNKKEGVNWAGRPWDPEWDVEYLHEAMDGCGTNEQAIINVVTKRCNSQRLEIRKKFKVAYGKDLMEEFISELSFNFEEAVLALFKPPAEYDARCIKKAIYGAGTDELTLIEILITRTNAQIKEIRDVYPIIVKQLTLGGEALDKDIQDDTSGDFKRLLISAAQGERNEIPFHKLNDAIEEVLDVDGNFTGQFRINFEKMVDMEKCAVEAKALFDAGEGKWGTNESEFNRIFSLRDYYTLRVIYDVYVKISQRDILNSVDRETSGNYKKALRAIVQNIRYRPMYLANRLKQAIVGAGTDDKTLIRVVVSRSEIDLVQIKECYLKLTERTLWRDISEDTSGDYKKLLLSLVGKN